MGQGRSRSGHEGSPKSNILFRACGTWFIVTFAHRIQKSKPFCNLTPCKSTTGKIQKGQIFELIFLNTKWVFLNRSISEFQKCHFYFFAMSRNAHNRSLKKWRYQRIWFLGYMFAKNRYMNLNLVWMNLIWTWYMHARCPGGLFTFGSFFWK